MPHAIKDQQQKQNSTRGIGKRSNFTKSTSANSKVQTGYASARRFGKW
jgi:hypothetical protein